MLEDLVRCIKKNMQDKGKTVSEIGITLAKIRKKYENDPIFNPKKPVVASPKIEEPPREERIEALIQKYEEHGQKTGEWAFPVEKDTPKRHEFGRSDLHCAVDIEDLKRIRELIKNKCDTSLKDNNGYTAYQQALLDNKVKVVQLFNSLGIPA